MIECSFDGLCSKDGTPLWFPLLGYFGLTTSSIEARVASNQSVLPSSHDIFIPCLGSVLLSLLLGGYIAIIVCTFSHWGLLPLLWVNTSRNQFSVQNVNFFCIDFYVSIAKLLKNPSRLSSRIVQKQSIWSLRLPQERQRRSSRWAHTFSQNSISSKKFLAWRSCLFHC